MHEGKLGEVKLARSIIYGGRGSIGGPTECVIPPRCDYDLWAGPAPLVKLTRPRLHYDWHWMWDTGNGDIGNSNVHSIDICRWGLGVTGLGRSVVSYGGRLGYTDVADTPNSQVGIFDFWRQDDRLGNAGIEDRSVSSGDQGDVVRFTAAKASSPRRGSMILTANSSAPLKASQ